MRKFLLIATIIAVAVPVLAFDDNTCSGSLCIQPISWNVIGLDSNNPTGSGPNEFMVGARVCNNGAATLTNVTTKLWWLSTNAAITLSDIDTISIPELKPGLCNDFYYNGLVARAKANHNTTKNYRVSVWADQAPATALGTAPWNVLGAVATPINRQLYVEKLVSQNRNQVLSISGPTDVFVGGIYTYKVDWSTATGGYEQIEHFVNLRNNTFRLLESHTDYSEPTGATNDSIYGDACGWDDLITSGTYRSCVGPTNYTGGKAGGATITSWFTVKILGAGSGTLTTLIYDYSGSSYHYNSDYAQAYNSLFITAREASDLSITITDTPDPATLGSTITYTGAVTNLGLSPILSSNGGVVTFAIPSGTTINPGTGNLADYVDFGAKDADWSCTTSGTTITCNLVGNMTDQVPATSGTFDPYIANYTFGVTVNSGTTGTALLAAASVTSAIVDSYPSNNAATTTTYFAAPTDADLAVTNVVSSPVITTSGAGSTVTFTQTLTNNGSAAATDPIFTTTVPANSTLTAFSSPSGWTCGTPAPPVTTPLAGPADITCTPDSGTLGTGAGNSVSFALTITAASATNGTALTSTATATSATRDPNSTNNLASATTYKVANASADLTISVTDNPDPVVAGETILYDNCIRNNGPDPSIATYTYTLPAGTTFTYVDYPAGWSCTTPNVGSAGTVSCTSNTALPVNPNLCYELDVVVTVSSTYVGTTVPYSATLTGSVTDSVSPNNAVQSTALASATSADLSISKSAPANGSVGVPMTYSILVTNNGPAAAPPNTTVTDTVPASMTINTVSAPCTVLGQTVTCAFTSAIPVGGVQVITINVTPNSGAGTTATNSAEVSNASDPVTGNNTDTADTFIYAATAASMFEAEAVRNGGLVDVSWNTSFEVDNLGFNLYRESGAARQQVNASLIAGSALVVGQGNQLTAGFSYHWMDRAPADGAVYWIETIDLDGTSDWHGPIIPRSEASSRSLMRAQAQSRTFDDIAAMSSAKDATIVGLAPEALNASSGKVSDVIRARQFDIAAKNGAKILTASEGLYRVTRAQLVSAGFDPGSDPWALQLMVDANEVPIAVFDGGDGRFDATDYFEFYAFGMDTNYSGTRAYFLVNGNNGMRFRPKEKNKAAAFGGTSFPFTLLQKPRTVFYGAQAHGTDDDGFYGPAVFNRSVVQSFNVSNADAAGGTPTLDVALQGATFMPHRVRVDLNGRTLGIVEYTLQNRGLASFAVPNSVLKTGRNDVTLLALNGSSDVSFLDYVRLTYAHTYTADSDSLRFPMTGATEATVNGFTSSDIRVVDVTDPLNPTEVESKVVANGGSFTLKVSPHQKGARVLFAATADRLKPAASIVANAPSTLSSLHNRADFVIITHPSFASALQPLVDQRNRQGIETFVANVDDVFDEFGFGSKSPSAIREFLQYTQERWKVAPKFVMLVGDASFDPRNYMGYGDRDLVPTRLLQTKFMKTASDDWMVDFDGDLLPNLFLGRLPVTTPAEAEAVVAKIVGYTPPASGRIVLAVDKNDTINFESLAAAARTTIPSGYAVDSIYFGKLANATAVSNALYSAANSKPSILNFIGHGSIESFSKLNVFRSRELEAKLSNSGSTPIYVLMNCLNAYFFDVWSYSLSESLMRVPNGGAVAVWSSTGQSEPLPQGELNRAFYRIIATRPGITIGEAVAGAKAATTDQDVRKTWSLFGDPTMRLGN